MRRAFPLGVIPLVCPAFVILASTASAQDAPIPEATAGQPVAAPAIDPEMVRVFLSSDKEGAIFGRAAALGPEQTSRRRNRFNYAAGVCTAPCSATVALSENPYRVVGPYRIPSNLFDLPFTPSGLDVHVRAGSPASYIVGLVLAVDGVAFAAAGGAMLLVYEALGQPQVVNHSPGAILPTGLLFFGLGVVFAGIGIPLWEANRTQIDISEHRTATGRRGVELLPDGIAF
jgi:hypothetical protein